MHQWNKNEIKSFKHFPIPYYSPYGIKAFLVLLQLTTLFYLFFFIFFFIYLMVLSSITYSTPQPTMVPMHDYLLSLITINIIIQAPLKSTHDTYLTWQM